MDQTKSKEGWDDVVSSLHRPEAVVRLVYISFDFEMRWAKRVVWPIIDERARAVGLPVIISLESLWNRQEGTSHNPNHIEVVKIDRSDQF